MKKFIQFAACMGLIASAVFAADAAPRPNVVLFFIDDMGYADIEPFGAKVSKTPNLAAMAKEGVKFTQFYNGWTACSPSRSSLLTGCHAGRIGMDGRVCFPNEPKALHPREFTMAEMFKTAGYRTGIFGKWHLGHLPGYLPPAHGFDEYWGIPYSNDMWNKRMDKYPPMPYIHNNDPVAIVDLAEDQSLLTRAFTDQALAFIRENHEQPFFTYIPYSAVHAPHFAHKPFLEGAAGKGAKQHYVAQVQEIDAAVGEVLALLRELKIDQNTLVLFMSDNGGIGHSEIQPLRGNKGGRVYEGHMRTPVVAWWPGTIPAGNVCDAMGITIDLLPTFAALSGATLSKNKIDGRDISRFFLDPEHASSPHTVIPYKEEGIRKGKWKLVGKELYDLEADIGESNNLAETEPEVFKELTAELAAWSRTLAKERRPHAQMNPCGAQVTEEAAAQLPRLADWMKAH